MSDIIQTRKSLPTDPRPERVDVTFAGPIKGGLRNVYATERIRLDPPRRTSWGQLIHGFAYVPDEGCWIAVDRPWREGFIEGVTA